MASADHAAHRRTDPDRVYRTLLITAVVSVVIGAICVRLKEIYFAFVTLAFQMLIHSAILSWVSLTGGDQVYAAVFAPGVSRRRLSNHNTSTS